VKIRDWINLAILTLIALAMTTTFPDLWGEVVAAWTLVTMGYLLILLGDRLGALVLRSRFDRVLIPEKREVSRPQDLERCEHSFGWKSYSARDFEHELRPQLEAIVVHRCKGGPVDQELLRPPGTDRDGDDYKTSIRTPDLAQLVDKIEQL
jgi:hypothetical protein